MELRHLRYFVGVAEALSFTKAAEKLHTAQPSLTRQIKDLEDELGVRLLNRTKQKVSLTDEGRSFFGDAKRLLALAAETVESVRRLHSGEVRALNVGYVSNLFYDLLPKTLASFHQSFPTISVNLFDMSCGEQFQALENGKLDLGFVGLHEPIARRGLEFRTIASYKTVVALPEDNPLAGKTTIELKALAPMFFIGMSEASYPGYRDWLTKTCHGRGFCSQGFAGCGSGAHHDSGRSRRTRRGARAGAIEKTRAREGGIPSHSLLRLGPKVVLPGGTTIRRLPCTPTCKSSRIWAAASVSLYPCSFTCTCTIGARVRASEGVGLMSGKAIWSIGASL